MKLKIYALTILSIFFSFGANAQCTGCTINITGPSAIPLVVGVGQKLCISSSGNLSGLLLVNGGEVCNEGTISSVSIAMTDGIFINSGTMTNEESGMTGGSFTNSGIANIDSILIDGSVITFTNNGALTSIAIGQSASGAGGIPAFHNNGTITCDSIGLVGGEFHNYGTLNVIYDMANVAPSLFENHCVLTVGRDLGNSGSFLTEKMVTVGNDFGNSGAMTGPTVGCGGFSVTGDSGNSGDFGVDGSNIDICDASSGSFDLNTGTLGSNVTFCTCTSTCSVGIVEHFQFPVSIYPNPANESFTISFEEIHEPITIRLTDVQGKVVYTNTSQTSNQFIVQKGSLTSGLYFLAILRDGKIMASEKIVFE